MVTEIIVAGVLITIANRMYLKFQPKIKGYTGEAKLARAMKRLKIPGKVNVLRDSLFPLERGGTSQVDVIAVTRYGVFIMENKNYNCDVYGCVTDTDWYCKYPPHKPSKDPLDYMMAKKYDKEEKQYNPIRQNKTHITAVSAILREKYPHIPYYPLVVFSNNANLYIQNSRNRVCNLKNLSKVVPRLIGKEVLTDKEVNEISDILKQNQLKGRRAYQNHVTAIQLERAARKRYSNEELKEVEKEYLRQSEDKPVLSAEGELPFYGQEGPRSYENKPLSEIIHTAKARTDTHDTAPDRPFSR